MTASAAEKSKNSQAKHPMFSARIKRSTYTALRRLAKSLQISSMGKVIDKLVAEAADRAAAKKKKTAGLASSAPAAPALSKAVVEVTGDSAAS